LPEHTIRVDCVHGSPTGRKRWRSYAVEVLGERAQNWSRRGRCGRRRTGARWWRCGCCRGRSFREAEDLENLVGPYLVGHAGVFSVPSDTAGAVAIARVLPDSARIRLNSPVVPEPLPVWI